MKVDFDDLLIRRAMTEKKCLSITYDGVKIRVLEPQALIRHKKTGDHYLMAFQTGGYSETISEGWKLFSLSKIYDATIIDVSFVPKNPNVFAWAEELESAFV